METLYGNCKLEFGGVVSTSYSVRITGNAQYLIIASVSGAVGCAVLSTYGGVIQWSMLRDFPTQVTIQKNDTDKIFGIYTSVATLVTIYRFIG